MTLFKRLKDHLGEVKSVVSDDEFILLNRQDFHLTQISPVNAFIKELNIRVGYPYRVLLSFLDQFCVGISQDDFNIMVADPSLTMAAFYAWVRSGGELHKFGKVYAPLGIAKIIAGDAKGLQAELLQEFIGCISKDSAQIPLDRRNRFTFILGNTRSSEQTHFAVDRYLEVQRGLLILKDYTKIDSFNERDYLESKLLFPSYTFEGHAFCLKN